MRIKKPTKWIGAMNSGRGPKRGALHVQMGIPQGQKIPQVKLAKAAKMPGIEGLRARLAETLKHLHHGKRK